MIYHILSNGNVLDTDVRCVYSESISIAYRILADLVRSDFSSSGSLGYAISVSFLQASAQYFTRQF